VLVQADSLEWLKTQPAHTFSAACFSPPYAASPALFDARRDFARDGRFIPFALEISRVADVWGVNFTQLVFGGQLLPFTEELTLALRDRGVYLFDRWVMHKKVPKPKRGERALSNFEFLLVFSAYPSQVKKKTERIMTAFPSAHDHQGMSLDGVGLRAYSRTMPEQLFRGYALGDPRPVLDPFCGTGTTLRVARELGLPYVGVDIEPKYIELCRRWGLS
jgi:hypothetical protein